jgi:gamma-glutamyl hercynylcysteine S-oxide synthase
VEVPILTGAKQATPARNLIDRLLEARKNSDELFQIVRPEFLYERPIPERHRIAFYMGHLEAFDWNLLRHHMSHLKSFAPEFDRLFAFGIDPVDGGLPTDQPEDWPTIAQIREYVKHIRQSIDGGLEAGDFDRTSAGAEPSLQVLLHVANEHRLMHAETLAYMFHQLRPEQKHKQPQDSTPEETVPKAMVKISAGHTTLGLARSDDAVFGWDNEFEAHDVPVPAFQMDKHMVTNGEFLDFLLARGYDCPRLWLAEDWRWKTTHDIRHPAFWKHRDGEWFLRGMFEEYPLPRAWPAYVSHAEASAYARWAGKSLPTEAQWHRAAYGNPQGADASFPWGEEAPKKKMGNFDFRRWDPTHVNAFPENKSSFGVVGQIGNGWEWTLSAFVPFDGFKAFSFYPGYSANFFDGNHYVMKGGSSRTAAAMLRRSFRNWFQPHYQYAYAGFRCVSSGGEE